MEIINFNVYHQEICTDREKLVSDTIGAYRCKFNFDSSWDDLNKVAVFVKGKNFVEYILDENNECPFADELIATTGTIVIGVYGTKDGVRYPTIKSKMLIVREGIVDGVQPTPPSLEIWEQLLNKIVEEKERAISKENALENGLNAEIERAKGKENSLNELINAETNARINADNTINNSINELDKDKADKLNTYTKQEVDDKIAQSTPQDYEQVKAQVQTNKTDISTINEKLPTLSLINETGNKIDLECDTTTYELKAKLYDKNNNLISTSSVIDLPLETLVLNVEYDSAKKAIIITLKDGTTKEVPVSDLVSGLVNQETFNTELEKKVDKKDGYSLMSEDEHTKLSGLENYNDTQIRSEIRGVSDKVDGLINDEEVTLENTWSSQKVADRLNEIELAKFPNVTIIGQPTIQQGQISNFSRENYCRFPFVVDFQNQPFKLDFEITTGADVTQQHNVFDSAFGLAFAVRQSKFVLAVSTNGTSWNIGEVLGSHIVLPNTTYRIRLVWDKQNLTLEYSTDGGASYVVDSTRPLTEQPYPKQMFIGITSDKSTIFNGIINLNYASLEIANKVVWQGMDDVGLATRMAVDMSNIDEAGINKVKSIVGGEGYATENWVNNQGFLKEHQSLDNYYTKSEVDSSQSAQDSIIDRTKRSLDYLWKKSKGIIYDEESVESMSNEVVVPSGAMDYASLDMLGGMSRKGKNLFSASIVQGSVSPADGFNDVSHRVRCNTGIYLTAGTYYISSKENYDLALIINSVNNPIGGAYIFIAWSKKNTEFTISNNSYLFVVFRKSDDSNITPNEISEVMISYGSTASPYEPYTDQLLDAKVDEIRWIGTYRHLLNDFQYDWLLNNQSFWNNNHTSVYFNYNENSVTCKNYNGTNYDVKKTFRTYVQETTSTYDGGYTYEYENNITLFANNGYLKANSTATINIPQMPNYPKPIPQSIQQLDGYGIGINDTLYNYFEKVDDKVLFHKRVGNLEITSTTTLWKDDLNRFVTNLQLAKARYNCGLLNSKLTYNTDVVWHASKGTDMIMCMNDDGRLYMTNNSCATVSDFESFIEGSPIYYELAEEVVTDVTDLFPADWEILNVEPNGTIEFHYPNKDLGYEIDTPNKVTYMVNVSEVA